MEMSMNRVSSALLAVVCLGAFSASAPALADNPLGFYVGAGVGASNVGNNDYYNGYPYGYYGHYNNGNNVAWKALIGLRPLPFVGAELEYMDFGSSNGNNGYYNNYYTYGANSHPKATLLYGVGYLPLPLPYLDVYGKLGVARLQTNISFDTCTSVSNTPSGPSCNPTTYRLDQTNDKFAYGAGIQAKYQDFAFRAEYEGISSNYGNPAAVTVSVTWTF
jgi:hypothetical protein